MQTRQNPSSSFRWLIVLLCGALANVSIAATLSVSPASTSNTYAGVITLQIGGLTNTEPVMVQEFLDANSNGTVDTGELLVDTFPISDGGVSTIGGQTNLNVPFDRNATGGAITTTLFFSLPLLVENFVGQHIFRVVSPSDRFAPVHAAFIVTNAAFLQLVTGQVFLGASPATNAIVVALIGQDGAEGAYAAGTVADSTGHYSLRLPTNNYVLIASQPNCYYDTSLTPQIALTNGMTATNNLYLTNGTVILSGSVRDATNNSGLGGVFLLLGSGDYFAIAFTASNGAFTAAVAPSVWKFELPEERVARRGYVVPADLPEVNTTTGAVANVNLLFPNGNAMFYGRFTNTLGAPFANVEFDANDGQNSPSVFKGSGFSDSDGYYSVAVLAETNAWYCSPSSDSSPLANYIVSQGQSVALTTGQAYRQDFIALAATARISGHVQDNAGNPVVGVSLGGGAFIGGVNYSPANALTDNSGDYSLAVAAGQWGVQFTFGDDSDTLENHGLVDLFGPYQVNIPPTNAVLNITVYPTGAAALATPQRTSPSQVSLNVNGSINTTYTLQVSTNLAFPNWASLFAFQLTANPFQVTDSQATNGQRFYRLLKN